MNYDEWIRLGEIPGLKGGELATFVKEKEADFLQREERLQRREEERRILQMQHELQIKEKELEVERIRITRPATESSSRVLHPKLPRFDEVSDDMDAYIERFERYAVSQGWEEETWAMSLSSLLTGKGLEVYTSMSPEEASDYTALKTAVLKRYQLTEEGFRMKFRRSRPEAGETVHQYLSRLKRYFSRWTEIAQEEQSYRSLCELMIREQFIQSCSSDLAMFLAHLAQSAKVKTRGKKAYSKARTKINDLKKDDASPKQPKSVRQGVETKSFSKEKPAIILKDRPSTIVGSPLKAMRPPRPGASPLTDTPDRAKPQLVIRQPSTDRPHRFMSHVEADKRTSSDDSDLLYTRVSMNLMADPEIQSAMFKSASAENLPKTDPSLKSSGSSGTITSSSSIENEADLECGYSQHRGDNSGVSYTNILNDDDDSGIVMRTDSQASLDWTRVDNSSKYDKGTLMQSRNVSDTDLPPPRPPPSYIGKIFSQKPYCLKLRYFACSIILWSSTKIGINRSKVKVTPNDKTISG